MMRSLFSGVSGLRNHQVRLDVIGNNVANVNTVAFKASRVTFKEGFAQLLQGASRPPGDHGGINPIQVGLGMQVGSIDQVFSQGNIETTGQGTDLAIQGEAFFVVAKGKEHFYTRSGNFQLDADGRLVSPLNGFVVQGRTAMNGVLQEGITDIRLPFGQKTAARPTGEVTLAGNLDASVEPFAGPFLATALAAPEGDVNGVPFTGAGPHAYTANSTLEFEPTASTAYYKVTETPAGTFRLFKNEVEIANATPAGPLPQTVDFGDVRLTLGAGYAAGEIPATAAAAPEAEYRFLPSTNEPENEGRYASTTISVWDSVGQKHELKLLLYKATETRWNYVIDPSSMNGVAALDSGASGHLDFNTDGTLNETTSLIPSVAFTPTGAEPVSIRIDPGSGINGITQFASTTTAVLRDQDGYGMGDLLNFTIDRTGLLTGSFSNGTNVALAQIVLADFNNPGGLMRTGDNMYSVSGNSGNAVLGFPLEGSQSMITSGALEMSNVDLASEFTNMIVTQRGFQANGRVITSSDEMLQEVVNLKR